MNVECLCMCVGEYVIVCVIVRSVFLYVPVRIGARGKEHGPVFKEWKM